MDNLKLEKISPTLSVYQTKGVFCYGTDGVLLAKYALSFYKSLKNKKMLDLCCGTGIVPLIVCDSNKDVVTSGVEINKDACRISAMSAEYSGYNDRFTVFNFDLKDVRSHFKSESFDFITCNPPYMTADSGKMCVDDYKTIARHEILCTIDDVFKAAFYLLPTGGSLYTVYRCDRLSSLFKAALNNRFEIKDMTFISSGKVPGDSKLVLSKAVKDGSEGLKLHISDIASV